MAKFGNRSLKNLSEAHPKLQKIFHEVIKNYDCSVIQGYRGMEEQMAAYHAGKSKVFYPNSKHNKRPSQAVDVVPYPIDWNDKIRFYHFAGYVKGVADALGIKIRCGADWDSDNDFKDQTFHDLPHFELHPDELVDSVVESNKDVLPDGPTDDEINDKLGKVE